MNEKLIETGEFIHESLLNGSSKTNPAFNEAMLLFVCNSLTILKEQEAKPMTEYDDGWDCPRCGLKLIGKTASGYPCDEFDLPNDEIVKYCPVCGQAVKWNDRGT